jgi:hypothetical protein
MSQEQVPISAPFEKQVSGMALARIIHQNDSISRKPFPENRLENRQKNTMYDGPPSPSRVSTASESRRTGIADNPG